MGLKERKQVNAALDIKKNILKAVVLQTPLAPKEKPTFVLDVYKEKITEAVVDAGGNILEEKTPEMIQAEGDGYPLYIYKEQGLVRAYCFPVKGKGLWGPIYGYLAIQPDGKILVAGESSNRCAW